MRLRLAAILPLGVFAAMGLVLVIGLNHDPRVLPSTLIGQPLPEFSLPALDPAQPPLKSAEMKGKGITLINVFGSWCPSCRAEHPLLMQEANDKRIQLIGIDWKDTADDANKYLTKFGNPYAAIGTDAVGRTVIDLGVSGAPETFVVDNQGQVRLRIPGPLSPEIWANDLEPLLAALGKSP